MENCCRSCMPCLSRLWNWIWTDVRYPSVPNHNHVIANPAAQASEIRTVSGDIRIPSPKKRPVQLYAALFDFEARSDEELTVKEGDKLSVIEKRGQYVLAKKLTGSLESGLIPANYVALLQDEFAKHNLHCAKCGLFVCLCSFVSYVLHLCVPAYAWNTLLFSACLSFFSLSACTLTHSFIHYCLFTVFIHFGDMSLSSIVWFIVCLFTLTSSVLLRHVCVSFYSLCRWYYGNINRVKAEKLLLASQNKDGSFLVRISESHSDEYTISVRSDGKVYHFRIQRSTIGAYFVSEKISFATLGELISYYQRNPRSLGVELIEPCAQQRELFDMEPWERPREEFKLHKKLGEGHFGEVWEAIWTKENKKVAIKMLKQEDTKQDEFVKEVQALKSLHHPRLIQLLAMCSRGEPVYIVTELMSKGSLKSYIASAEGQVLTSAHLIYMGSQVADGMAYLEDRNIVHRDLAARNILVGDDLVCKVADFGLARIIKDNVYTASRNTKIPVRWTAPEAAIYQRFSVKSDVWSFGVLLYEMMSRGKMPYEGKSNKEVLDILSSGFRLPCPTRCPQNIYRIMMDCWAAEPSKRPSFHALHSQLDAIYARIYFKTIEV